MGSMMLLDTASLYFRAFYGVPETLTAPDGTPVNAVRGLPDKEERDAAQGGALPTTGDAPGKGAAAR